MLVFKLNLYFIFIRVRIRDVLYQIPDLDPTIFSSRIFDPGSSVLCNKGVAKVKIGTFFLLLTVSGDLEKIHSGSRG
jgi:hypothetical protein